jgi:hypothetical protein
VAIDPPGVPVNIHDPFAGNPFSSTLPVVMEQVGCVIIPKTGAAGVAGCTLIVILADPGEVHPAAFVTE